MALASLLLLLLSSECAAKSCRYADVQRWSWSWSFDLEGCTSLDFTDSRIGSRGARALAEALKTNSVLTTLDLWVNSIGDEGARALAEALKTNGVLTTLKLGETSIGDEGARALAEALKTNGVLTTLHLGGNSIGADGAMALAEALKTNGVLTTLNLGRNSIGDEGVRALAEALKTNGVLTMLLLWGNSIGDEGARALAEALKTNGVLTTLNLGDNSIGDEGVRALVEALKTNGVLTKLSGRGAQVNNNNMWAEVLKSTQPEERRRKCDLVLDLIDQEQAKLLGLYAVFQELGIAGDALARALRWCRDQGAEAAEDLNYLKREEVDQLVEILGLGLPILKQRKLAEKLATQFRGSAKDEV